MSIPPLVCSTPPPPDQCEDDKDAEDFDMQYNLSNYDDEDNSDYNYGDFSSYDQFESSLSEKKDESSSTEKILKNYNKNDDILKEESELQVEGITGASITNNLSTEEDIVEDLDLKLDQESVSASSKNEAKYEDTLNDNDTHSSIKNELSNIPSSSNINISHNIPSRIQNILEDSTKGLDHVEEIESFNVVGESNLEINKSENLQDFPIQKVCVSEINKEEFQTSSVCDTVSEINKEEFNISPICDTISEINKEELNTSFEPKNENVLNDDFDDFQFINSDDKVIDSYPAIADTCENPWENNEGENSDFGNFTANFENNNNDQLNTTLTHTDLSSDNKQIETQINLTHCVEDDEDDFGDFDDFRSSGVESTEMVLPQEPASVYQQVPVLNLQSPDNEVQVMERINKILNSIFEEELTETDEKFEATLDGLLSETWGHLMETDVRQPYMVNWNKSLAQKTLLKALCIDSRNILFGPKWSYNSMPKYAANLSTAPLQPQKQATPNTQNDIPNIDKVTNKSGTWTDPFTSNGQESCSNNSDKTVIEPTPTDLDVFEAAISTKADKVYSSTLSVQPIRQINLPDTHIFTPTDSETPRSKTIHYNCGPAPTVLIPKPVIDNLQNKEDKINNSLDNVIGDTDEYWEFQDFKGTTDTNSSQPTVSLPQNQLQIKEDSICNTLPKSNIIYETQLLQPIKMEPIMPTLNWPDPGEVKETFDDFSNFISSSSTNNEKQDVRDTRTVNHNTSDITLIDKNVLTVTKQIEQTLVVSDSYDDDFDTFQSALPSNSKTIFELNFNNLESKSSHNVQSQNVSAPLRKTDFDVDFPVNDNLKSDNISFTNNAMLNDASSTNIDITSSQVLSTRTGTGVNPCVPLENTNMLQPTLTPYTGQMQSTSSGLTQSQQKSGQILQPLSLESYSQINWPNPGIDLQDLSRFNPVESLQSLKSDSTSGHSKTASPVHNKKNIVNNQTVDDDIWGEFVSSKPKPQPTPPKKSSFVDDDEWTDFVSSPSVKPNGLNTISFNVHTNSSIQKSMNQNKYGMKNNEIPLDIPTLNYITPKTNNHNSYNDRHFQNL
ncbi:uncharacterized protein LOC113519632 isoform X2 [Galleria mellonella]|uniref:Uncharacterized protein LOC113519632 isoform X2 n=1 Tax=Galleria mellonella TaxID=7137 RepID=A0A6J1WW64_GALME|nr:uncharacterized protein LOC113519632 isoform X2 [Galleria mellonella]